MKPQTWLDVGMCAQNEICNAQTHQVTCQWQISWWFFIFADMQRVHLPWSAIHGSIRNNELIYSLINECYNVTIQVICFNALSVCSCFLNHFIHFHYAFSVNDLLRWNFLSISSLFVRIAHAHEKLNCLKSDMRDGFYFFLYLLFSLPVLTCGSHLIRFKKNRFRLYDTMETHKRV